MTEKKTKRKKTERGGARANSGRRSIYPGKDRTRHATAYLTPEGWTKLEALQARLAKSRGEEVTSSDTIEDCIHLAAKVCQIKI